MNMSANMNIANHVNRYLQVLSTSESALLTLRGENPKPQTLNSQP